MKPWFSGAFVMILAGACGGGTSGPGGGGGAAGSGGGAGSGGDGGMGASGGSGGAGGAAPVLAPTLDAVEPLAGGLHVMWTNNTPDCDQIELDRNKDGGAFATEYTLTGAAESQHDTAATAPGAYCYKARCIRGAETSPDSNEKCGQP